MGRPGPPIPLRGCRVRWARLRGPPDEEERAPAETAARSCVDDRNMIAKLAFFSKSGTAESEPCKVCPLSVKDPPGYPGLAHHGPAEDGAGRQRHRGLRGERDLPAAPAALAHRRRLPRLLRVLGGPRLSWKVR